MSIRVRCPAALWIVAFAFAGIAQAQETVLADGARGGSLMKRGPLDHLTDAWRMEVQADLNRRIGAMLADGRLAPAEKAAGILFQWPARLIPGAPDAVPHVIANYLDQNLAAPNQVRDFECGSRSYDLASGYNHRGVDISAFPFGWAKMDTDEMIVVAAAAGTIIRRDDGAFDRNCGPLGSLPGNTPVNSIYLRHADGSVSWYLHMKQSSLTPKPVGGTVAAGERLGTVGSSGFSSGPHLHFEVYDGTGALVDPFAGACNTRNVDSWWAQQPPYWDPAIVRLTVHAAPVSFGDCTTAAAPNTVRHLTPGSTFHATYFLRDFLRNASIPVRILRPDGSEFLAGTLANDQGIDYVASYWYYSLDLPAGAPGGAWRLQGTIGGKTVETVFHVVAAAPSKTPVVEYFHAGFGHYFVTADAGEIAFLDGGGFGGAWTRTGKSFPAYASGTAGAVPVCRFFSASFAPKGSHFYSAHAGECDGLKGNPDWVYEGTAFHLPLPAPDGTCPAGTLPVYRMYNQAQTGAPNHRFTTDYATRLAFVPAQGWVEEGSGSTGIGMCSPLTP